ncbi:MAG: hypothetical protein SNG27_09210 [Rikenellaceae bacterium]
MKRLILLTVLLCAAMTQGYAQDKESKKVSIGVETSLHRGISDVELKGCSPVSFYGGYNFNSHIFVGAGFGFTKYYGTLLIPVNAKVQWTPFDWMLSPYLACDIGYNLLGGTTKYELIPGQTPPYHLEPRYGFFIRPELGANLKVSPSSSLYFGVGIYGQSGEFKKEYIVDGDMITEVVDNTSVVSLKLGYKFSF